LREKGREKKKEAEALESECENTKVTKTIDDVGWLF
jgi:hypothetical protein